MDIVFYVVIFIIGALLGSFYAMAIRRLSKGKKVFTMHSYCSNCGKKINFYERIPILSYILIKGKCKECNKKINKTYIFLEVIVGILYLILAYGLDLKISDVNITDFTSFIFITLYLSYIILTIGLDKESKKTSALLLAYGIIISIIYIVYLCIVDSTTIYKNIVYLIIMTLLLLLNIINTKKHAQSSYTIDLLTTLLVMLIFTQEITCIITIIATLIAIALYLLISKMKNKNSKISYSSRIRIAYIMGILNIITFLILINISK